MTKTDIIDCLKHLQKDYDLTIKDDAMKKVIDWLINCTPEYPPIIIANDSGTSFELGGNEISGINPDDFTSGKYIIKWDFGRD
jgi:hypothetical protein